MLFLAVPPLIGSEEFQVRACMAQIGQCVQVIGMVARLVGEGHSYASGDQQTQKGQADESLHVCAFSPRENLKIIHSFNMSLVRFLKIHSLNPAICTAGARMPTVISSTYVLYFQWNGKTLRNFWLPVDRLPNVDGYTNSYGGIRTRISRFIFQLTGNVHSTAPEYKVQLRVA
jgi:hypothetical protein